MQKQSLSEDNFHVKIAYIDDDESSETEIDKTSPHQPNAVNSIIINGILRKCEKIKKINKIHKPLKQINVITTECSEV